LSLAAMRPDRRIRAPGSADARCRRQRADQPFRRSCGIHPRYVRPLARGAPPVIWPVGLIRSPSPAGTSLGRWRRAMVAGCP